MAINERLIDTEVAAAGNGGGAGSGNQEEGLVLHLDANDVDSYDGDGTEWVDITNHEYTPTTNVSEHFNTIIWDGDGSTNRDINGVGFAPDLVWIKRYAPNYGGNRDHRVFDTLRGAGKVIYSSGTFAEATPTNELNGFLDDGFNVGNSDAVNANIYGVEKYVAWCFKAGGAPSGSDKVSIDGTSYATMSAAGLSDGTLAINKLSTNTDLGFSILEYTGNGSSSTIGHGLGVSPELILIKSTSNVSSWSVFTPLGSNHYMFLNESDAAYSGSSNWWDNTEPTANVFTIGTYGVHNTNNAEYVAYCFASKRGVSKVGSYEGSGAAGNKVYTGFEPAWLMVKESSSTGNWRIMDNVRDTGNVKDLGLWANLTNNESASSSNTVSFNRDGFTLQGDGSDVNTTNQTYIYLAFAKDTNETELHDTDLELHLDADSFPEKGESGYSNTPSTWTALTGSNGTISGATFDSELGNYLDFDGSNDYVSIPSSSTTPIDFTSKSYSIECWVNIDSNTIHPILAKYGTTDSLRSTNFNITSSRNLSLYERISSSGHTSLSTSALSLNTWHHVCVVRKSSQVEFYIDGELDNTVSATGTPNSGGAQNINIGSQANGNYSFLNGKIGQLRAYSSTLTQDQVRQNFNFTKNDYPNGNNFTKSGDVSWNSNGYFDFDGVNDRFNAISFKGRPIQSWALWINPDSVSTRYTILTTYPTGTIGKGGMYIELRDDAKIEAGLRTESGSTSSVNSTTTLSANQWQHIVVTSDGTDLTIYINSVERGSTSASVTTFQDSLIAPLGIGYEIRNVRNYFNGQMSDIKVYDKALTQGEIDAQFAIKQTDIG